jgi:hypothetical protein
MFRNRAHTRCFGRSAERFAALAFSFWVARRAWASGVLFVVWYDIVAYSRAHAAAFIFRVFVRTRRSFFFGCLRLFGARVVLDCAWAAGVQSVFRYDSCFAYARM